MFPVGRAQFLTPFPAVVDRTTFRPEAPETRHCLEELPATAPLVTGFFMVFI